MPAPSVGVAQPDRIEPSAKAIRIVGGTSPRKNSRQTCARLSGIMSSGSGGPSLGFSQQRPTE